MRTERIDVLDEEIVELTIDPADGYTRLKLVAGDESEYSTVFLSKEQANELSNKLQSIKAEMWHERGCVLCDEKKSL
jgi:hypothetical protein